MMVVMAASGCDSVDNPSAPMHGSVAGAELTEQFCGGCHVTPKPQGHSANEWPAVVARMLDNMHRSNRPTPTPEQINTILDYLQANVH